MCLFLDVVETQRFFIDFKRRQRCLDQTNNLKVCNHLFYAGHVYAVHNAAVNVIIFILQKSKKQPLSC